MTAPDPRVAEVVAQYLREAGIGGERLGEISADNVGRGVASRLDAAGLLAPPPPRTWQSGDPEPDGVRCVVDREGYVWMRFGDGDGAGWLYGALWLTWPELRAQHGPVTEVPVPGAPS